jgi:hypothetical protein
VTEVEVNGGCSPPSSAATSCPRLAVKLAMAALVAEHGIR